MSYYYYYYPATYLLPIINCLPISGVFLLYVLTFNSCIGTAFFSQ